MQKGQLDQHTKASQSLFGSIRVMESKLSEAKSKKDTLKVRARYIPKWHERSTAPSNSYLPELEGVSTPLRSTYPR